MSEILNDASGDVVTSAPEALAEETLERVDSMTIELAKGKVQLAVSNAKTALAEQEKSELAYRLAVTQIFMKYGLTSQDTVSEDGVIKRGGALNDSK